MAIVKKLTRRGFTLIELMIVVVIIGILASLAIYGVQKYVANSKSAEARTMLGRLSKDALVSFEGEKQDYAVLAPGTTAAISRSLCATATNTVPTSTGAISAKKYQPEAAEWKTGDADTGWACLNFSVSTPIYYQYAYEASGTINPAAADATFTAIAEGNLDGDSVLSHFELGGKVFDESGELTLVLATTIDETNPEE